MNSPRASRMRFVSRKLFPRERWMFSSRRASSVSRGTASVSSVEKICIWNQSQTLVHPAALHSSSRDSCPSVGPGLNWEAPAL